MAQDLGIFGKNFFELRVGKFLRVCVCECVARGFFEVRCFLERTQLADAVASSGRRSCQLEFFATAPYSMTAPKILPNL